MTDIVLSYVVPLVIGGLAGHFGARLASGVYWPPMVPGAPLTYRYEFQQEPNYATYVRARGWGYHTVTTLDDRTVIIRASDEMRELRLDDV